MIGVAGHGIAERMYLPVLDSLGIAVKVLHLPRVGADGGWVSSPTPAVRRELRKCSLFLASPPPFAHERYATLGLEEGVPVICEKPVGIAVTTPKRLLHKSLTSDVPIFANYQLRLDPCMVRLRGALQNKRIIKMDIAYLSGARRQLRSKPAWYSSKKLGGGVTFAVGSHLVDLSRFLSGEVVRLSPVLGLRPHDIMDAVTLRGGLLQGGTLSIVCSLREERSAFTVDVVTENIHYSACLHTGEIAARCANDGRQGTRQIWSEPVARRPGRRDIGVWKSAFAEALIDLLEAGPLFTSVANMTDAIRVHELLSSGAE